MDLHDAGAIVTGGASGIGAATVERLKEAGARVAVLDRTGAAGVAADLALTVDVSDEASVVDAVRDVRAAFGRIDAAVLSAGVGGSAPLLELSTEEWDRVMCVNLRGAFITLRECARAMRDDGGAIVAVTSVSGFLHERSMAHYGASKAALAHLVGTAARELGDFGIRVNGVAPGTTETPMFARTAALRGYRERVTNHTALARLGTADDVAQTIVALCALDWVTGQVIAADGGLSLHSPIDPVGD